MLFSDFTTCVQLTVPMIDERYKRMGLSSEKIAQCEKWLRENRWSMEKRPPIAFNTPRRFDTILKNAQPL
jgi:hypothetical protein